MSGFRRFRPLGQLQLETIESRLASAAKAWSEHWFGGKEVLLMDWKCSIARHCPLPEMGQCWQRIGGDEKSFFLLSEPGQCFEAVARWFGTAKAAEDPSQRVAASERLFERIFGDLLRRCVAVSGDAVGFENAASWPRISPGANIADTASGATVAELSAWFGKFLLVISPTLSQELSRPEKLDGRDLPRPHLAARLEAIQAQTVRLELQASIDGQLTVGAVDELAVGDVVLLSGKVSEPFMLSSPSGAVASQGFLGRRGGRRALRLVKVN